MIKISHRKETPEVDLKPIQQELDKHESHLLVLNSQITQSVMPLYSELEMQRRALIAIKTQRDIDRSRRFMLIKRMKREHQSHKKTELILALTTSAALLVSILSLIIKL